MRRLLCLACCLFWLPLGAMALTATPMGRSNDRRRAEVVPEGPTPKEIELGKRYSKEIERDRQFKLVKDDGRVRQLTELARSLCAVSARPKFEYVVKIFEDREPNAFTLPGGYIYVASGLLEFVRSDHELAGVMAHEIAHNARQHQMKMSAKENRLMWVNLLTQIGALFAASSQANELRNRTFPSANRDEASKVYAPFLLQNAAMAGLINRYSIEYERDADAYGFEYLLKTDHNPVGLLTFMERMGNLEQRRPQVDLGVYMTHPPTKERVEAAYERLRQLGIPVNRSATTTGPKPRAEALAAEGSSAAQVLVGDYVLFKLAGKSPSEALLRAQEAADRLERATLRGLRGFELRKHAHDDQVIVLAGKELLLLVRTDDVSLNQEASTDTLAQKWIDNTRRLLLRGVIGG